MMSNHTARNERVQQESPDNVLAFHPVKPRPFGHTKTVVADGVSQAGGISAVAAFFGKGEKTVYGWTNDDVQTTNISYDKARRLTKFLGVTAFAEDLANQAGGYFVPLPGPSDEAVLKLCSEAQLRNGAFWAELFKALEDGKITQEEATQVGPLLPALIRVLVGLRNNLNQIAEGRDNQA